MSYDLKNLKRAINGQIPVPPVNEVRFRKVLRKKKQHRRISGALTAAAAVVMLFAALSTIMSSHTRPGTDYIGPGSAVLSPGGEAASPSATDTAQNGTESIEDLSLYDCYSPEWTDASFPDRAEFGSVVIRRNEDGQFVFEDKDTGEAILPGEWQQAFAYFPVTGTGLVGNGDGMAILGEEGLETDFVLDSLEYLGGGRAIVSCVDEWEEWYAKEIGQEVWGGYTLAETQYGGSLLEVQYDEIGYTVEDGVMLLLGNSYETVQDADGEIRKEKEYTDVMDSDGNFIINCYDFLYCYEGKIVARLVEGGGLTVCDMQGGALYGGREFADILFTGEGYASVTLMDGGCGILDGTGEWVVVPGEYLSIEAQDDGTFVATDYELNTWRMDAAGERISDVNLWLSRAWRNISGRFEGIGLLGGGVLIASAAWLLIRLIRACVKREISVMMAAELGWALLIAGFLLISHRMDGVPASLWPAESGTAGELVWLYGFMAIGALTAMVANWRWLRRPWRAALMGVLLICGPWAFKTAALDMGAVDWRIVSALILLSAQTPLLMRTKLVKRFMKWCARLDRKRKGGRTGRMVWYALTLAALINFAAGSYLSGQEMEYLSYATDYTSGTAGEYDGQWIAYVNGLYSKYVDQGGSEEVLTDAGNAGEAEAVLAVEWMEENGLEKLTEDMLRTVRVQGSVTLGRSAGAQMYLTAEESGVLIFDMDSPMAGQDGSIECSAVMLVSSEGAADDIPELEGWLYVSQPSAEWIASERVYVIDMGLVFGGEEEADVRYTIEQAGDVVSVEADRRGGTTSVPEETEAGQETGQSGVPGAETPPEMNDAVPTTAPLSTPEPTPGTVRIMDGEMADVMDGYMEYGDAEDEQNGMAATSAITNSAASGIYDASQEE